MKLPKIYPRLSPREQKEARLALLRCRTTPADAVDAWKFFTTYYLDRDPFGKRLPRGFFYKRRLPTPQFHEQIILDIVENDKNMTAAPRSSAKSTVLKSWALLEILTRPFFKVLIVCSTDMQVQKWIDPLMMQMDINPHIMNDFGKQKLNRGEGMWSRHALTTRIRSKLEGLSVGAKMLGERPDLIILDDPEYDPDAATKGTKDTGKMGRELENLLFNTILPMLDMGDTDVWTHDEDEPVPTIYWIGTLLHRRNYIYHAIKTDKDTRFTKFWNRRLYTVLGEAGQPEELLWKEKWSYGRIARLREEYGDSAFRSSYMNDPASDEELLLKMDPAMTHYWITGADGEQVLHPAVAPIPNALSIPGDLVWNMRLRNQEGTMVVEEQRAPWTEAVGNMYRLMTVDYASTISLRSDFSGILVQGFTNDGSLFVLDLWLRRVTQAVLIEKIYELGAKWSVHVCGVEAVGVQKQLEETVAANRMAALQQYGWAPRVVPITYPQNLTKGDRIAAALEWRFSQGTIKLPADLANVNSEWQELHSQIKRFSPDLHLLDHDDAVDMLSMHIWLKGQRHGLGQRSSRVQKHNTPLEALELGMDQDINGRSYLEAVNACDLTPAAEATLERAKDLVDEEAALNEGRSVHWRVL